MTLPDFVNGLFEAVGGVCTWANVIRLSADKKVRGVDWRVTFFWWAWGCWNLIYYPLLHQPFSLAGGVLLCAGNGAWIILALKYRNQ